MKILLNIVGGTLLVSTILLGMYMMLDFTGRLVSHRIDAIVKEIKTNDCGAKK